VEGEEDAEDGGEGGKDAAEASGGGRAMVQRPCSWGMIGMIEH